MVQIYEEIKDSLVKYPFILIIGKFDTKIGPKMIFSSYSIENQSFIQDLISDAIDTQNKFVILDHNQFYSQVCKVEIKDPKARGGFQLYTIILLRDKDNIFIPRSNFKKIEKIFNRIGSERILKDDEEIFQGFFEEINKIYSEKKEILPLEAMFKGVRTGTNTILGYCDLILEKMDNDVITNEQIKVNINYMISACNEIVNALGGKSIETLKEKEEVDLQSLFEKENPGKKAIWRGKETKSFKEWKKKRINK